MGLVTLQVLKFLGKGSYGSVYLVDRLTDKQSYAVKETDVTKMSTVERDDAANEIRLLASVKHPNIVRYYGAFLDGNWLCIIMEYAQCGDLAHYIKKGLERKTSFPEEVVWSFFIQIARVRLCFCPLLHRTVWQCNSQREPACYSENGPGSGRAAQCRTTATNTCLACLQNDRVVVQGLDHMHKKKILHRDIKPMNIFIGKGDIVKIGDLGIAKILKNNVSAQTQIGTPHYMAPEIWRGKPYTYSADVWALGCLLYEMMTYAVRLWSCCGVRQTHAIRSAMRAVAVRARTWDADCVQHSTSIVFGPPGVTSAFFILTSRPRLTCHCMCRCRSRPRACPS